MTFPHKFPIKHKESAIQCVYGYGPIFGGLNGLPDLQISPYANIKPGVKIRGGHNSTQADLGSTYQTPCGLRDDRMFAGQWFFALREWEVWSLDYQGYQV